MGPPGRYTVRLTDGSEWTQDRTETWFCAEHQAQQWGEYMRNQPKIVERRHRLDVFAACRAEGLHGADLFAEAERRLREGE